MKCLAHIQAGVCGFATKVTADSLDDQSVTLTIETDCDTIAGLAEAPHGTEIAGYHEIAKGFDGVVI